MRWFIIHKCTHLCVCHCLLLFSREVSSELKKLTEVLEKLQHRPRDAEGRNLYDEARCCHCLLLFTLLLLTHREMTIAGNYKEL